MLAEQENVYPALLNYEQTIYFNYSAYLPMLPSLLNCAEMDWPSFISVAIAVNDLPVLAPIAVSVPFMIIRSMVFEPPPLYCKMAFPVCSKS